MIKFSYTDIPPRQGCTQGEGDTELQPPKPPTPKLKKNADFVDIMTSKVLRDLPFRRYQPLKSVDD
jgi:hypothetical protein